MTKIPYKDIITIVDTIIDGYGTESIGSETQVKANFFENIGYSHSSNQDSITSKSYVYVDFENDFIKDNFNRLEGMLVVANPYSGIAAESWYRITSVNIGQDKLLTNSIDNIVLQLSKTTGITNVS